MSDITLSALDVAILKHALISARYHYFCDLCEHGESGNENPDPDIKAAMKLLGMHWEADEMEIFHGDKWAGNESHNCRSTLCPCGKLHRVGELYPEAPFVLIEQRPESTVKGVRCHALIYGLPKQ